MLSKAFFTEQFSRIVNTFLLVSRIRREDLTPEVLEAYYIPIAAEMDEQSFLQVVEIIVRNEPRFPSVATFFKYYREVNGQFAGAV